MKHRIEGEGALRTAREQMERLQKMLERTVRQHRDDPKALRLQSLQITRLMEDLQSEIDDYVRHAKGVTLQPAARVRPARPPVRRAGGS